MTEEQIKYVEEQIGDAKKLVAKIDKLKSLLNSPPYRLHANNIELDDKKLVQEVVTIGLATYLSKAEESLANAQISVQRPEPVPV